MMQPIGGLFAKGDQELMPLQLHTDPRYTCIVLSRPNRAGS